MPSGRMSIYETGKWLNVFTKTIIVTIEKKMNASECADHITINLIAHASKIMFRHLGKRIEKKAKYFMENTVWIQKRIWNGRSNISNEIPV